MKTMKTLKFFNYILLVIAILLAITAVFAFVNGNITSGICNILCMGCEVVFFWANKIHIEIEQDKADVYVFLSDMNDTIEKYGAAIITDNRKHQGWSDEKIISTPVKYKKS